MCNFDSKSGHEFCQRMLRVIILRDECTNARNNHGFHNNPQKVHTSTQRPNWTDWTEFHARSYTRNLREASSFKSHRVRVGTDRHSPRLVITLIRTSNQRFGTTATTECCVMIIAEWFEISSMHNCTHTHTHIWWLLSGRAYALGIFFLFSAKFGRCSNANE